MSRWDWPPFALGFCALALIVGGAYLAALSGPEAAAPASLPPEFHAEPQAPPPSPVPRAVRVPVAGAEGSFVVTEPDGSVWLEGPEGRRQLAAAAPPPRTLPASQAAPPRRVGGRLVVLDAGVVDVPAEAVVTHLGKDKLVTHGPDGSSVVYHVDGRVERRERLAGAKGEGTDDGTKR